MPAPPVASYQRINYNLRPAKNIERKMMVEALRRLDRVTNLQAFRYIGFGSPYFADFALFHKALDLPSLVSIERNSAGSDRFEFNKPYQSIDILYGDASEVLPTLKWDQPSIVWLDYDSPLEPSMLGDIEGVLSQAAPWSVLIVTVDAEPGEVIEERVEELEDRLPQLVPPGLSGEELGDWGTADVSHGVAAERIEKAIRDRNVGRPLGTTVSYRQLFNFRYRDGARMLTFGGILVPDHDSARFDLLAFGDFPYLGLSGNAYEITVPKLTYRELDHLDAQLPRRSLGGVDRRGIPVEDVERYSKVYRFFPRFVDADR